jgi:hypothetical protein
VSSCDVPLPCVVLFTVAVLYCTVSACDVLLLCVVLFTVAVLYCTVSACDVRAATITEGFSVLFPHV